VANITTGQLKEKVAQATGLTRPDVARVIDVLFQTVEEELRQGNRVELRSLVSLRVDEAAPQLMPNPRTGQL